MHATSGGLACHDALRGGAWRPLMSGLAHGGTTPALAGSPAQLTMAGTVR